MNRSLWLSVDRKFTFLNEITTDIASSRHKLSKVMANFVPPFRVLHIFWWQFAFVFKCKSCKLINFPVKL